LKGRQDPDAVARCGLRLQLLKQQALAGDIELLFADESEALTHPYLARAWAKRGADLRVEAPGQSARIAMIGAFDFVSRELIVETSRTKKSADVVALLERLDRIYGPKPGAPHRPVTIVLDNGPVHRSKTTLAALAAREHWLKPEWLAKYAPELNDIEREWKTLKTHHLAHKTFKDADGLGAAIEEEIKAINSHRKPHPFANQRISA
jgi:transposase